MKTVLYVLLLAAVLSAGATLSAQSSGAQQPAPPSAPPATMPSAPPPAATQPAPAPAAATPAGSVPAGAPVVTGVPLPPDYLIGPEDILTIVFWREKDLSSDAMVRPDGRISLPLLNDVMAAGLTPEQLQVKLMEQARRYVEDPNVTVVVKTINSRKVFVLGEVAKPGPYPLMAPTTVMQLLSMTGGPLEYADVKKITIMRHENGKDVVYKFNYKDVVAQKNLKQNIELKPGDTIVIP